ncbi:MAG TPA: hypothetical protein VN661_03310 [Candidatus Acidoferrales bacterium]|nr:hypothetical protein [Candidatus Acidoferrales bacterium]
MKFMKRHFTAALVAAAGIWLAISAVHPRPASAGSLSTTVIGMFPSGIGEFAYADLKSARQYSWFPQLRDQLLPGRFRDFEKFLASAGVDPDTQIDELAWAGLTQATGVSDQVVGVALGRFDPNATEEHFKQQKLPVIQDHSYNLYAFGSGSGAGDIYFMFIDSNTAAFGQRAALDKLLDVRTGAADSLLANDAMYSLVKDANGSGLIWAALNQDYTHLAVQQLLPQANQFPQAAEIVKRLKAMTIGVDASNGVDAHFQAICSSSQDANVLAAALQAGVMYRRYQETQSNPALADALNGVHITPSGDRLTVDAPVTQDQLITLIHSHALSAPM